MDPLLKDIKINTWFISLPTELINEIERFRLYEVQEKSRKFIKYTWLKCEMNDHQNGGGLAFRNLDSNEYKEAFDENSAIRH